MRRTRRMSRYPARTVRMPRESSRRVHATQYGPNNTEAYEINLGEFSTSSSNWNRVRDQSRATMIQMPSTAHSVTMGRRDQSIYIHGIRVKFLVDPHFDQIATSASIECGTLHFAIVQATFDCDTTLGFVPRFSRPHPDSGTKIYEENLAINEMALGDAKGAKLQFDDYKVITHQKMRLTPYKTTERVSPREFRFFDKYFPIKRKMTFDTNKTESDNYGERPFIMTWWYEPDIYSNQAQNQSLDPVVGRKINWYYVQTHVYFKNINS